MALDADNAATAAGYRRAALQRPPSWAGPAAAPSPGAWCSCCQGRSWWAERVAPKGWRCATWHPAAHMLAEAVHEVVT